MKMREAWNYVYLCEIRFVGDGDDDDVRYQQPFRSVVPRRAMLCGRMGARSQIESETFASNYLCIESKIWFSHYKYIYFARCFIRCDSTRMPSFSGIPRSETSEPNWMQNIFYCMILFQHKIQFQLGIIWAFFGKLDECSNPVLISNRPLFPVLFFFATRLESNMQQ